MNRIHQLIIYIHHPPNEYLFFFPSYGPMERRDSAIDRLSYPLKDYTVKYLRIKILFLIKVIHVVVMVYHCDNSCGIIVSCFPILTIALVTMVMFDSCNEVHLEN